MSLGPYQGMSAEQAIAEAAKRHSNRGRWGPDDELGTANFITPEKIREAARLVCRGRAFALATPFDGNGPQTGQLGRVNPIRTMYFTGPDWNADGYPFPHGFGGADDMVFMPLQCATQWDSLAHVFDHGELWNGYPASEVTSIGARRCGIQNHRDRLLSRGVLLDVARAKGVEVLDDGYPITESDLLETIEAQGETAVVGTGDIVIVRTGQLGERQRGSWGDYAGGAAPGLSFSTVDWLHRTEVAAIATDTWGVEVRPNEFPNAMQPLHQVVIPHLGLLLGEIWQVDALAADCAEDGVWEFLLVAPPLPFTGGVGSPVNPIAIK